MKIASLVVVALLASASALAAEPKTRFIDHSNSNLISEKAATSLMAAIIPATVWRVYPATKYAFVSQVEGGMNGTTCVVAARVMVLPLSPTMKAALFRPRETATAFDSATGSSTEQCRTMAREKLQEATRAVVSSLVKQ